MRILVQKVGAEGDVIDDSTVQWPDERLLLEFGNLELNGVVPDGEAAQRQIIFDPIPPPWMASSHPATRFSIRGPTYISRAAVAAGPLGACPRIHLQFA